MSSYSYYYGYSPSYYSYTYTPSSYSYTPSSYSSLYDSYYVVRKANFGSTIAIYAAIAIGLLIAAIVICSFCCRDSR